jgi:hypothetical protein
MVRTGGAEWLSGLNMRILSMRDIEHMTRFLETAFPEFRVRGEGISQEGTRWGAYASDETYIALSPFEGWNPRRTGHRNRLCRG